MSGDAVWDEHLAEAILTFSQARALIEAAAARLDPSVAEILTFHAIIEQQMDDLISALLPRPKKISRLSYRQKTQTIAAFWDGNEVICDMICELACWFDDLRNGAAHNDQAEMKAALRKIADRCVSDRGETPLDAAGVIVSGLHAMTKRLAIISQPIGASDNPLD